MKEGWVHTGQGFRPFTDWRRITKGARAGMIELEIRKPSVSRDKQWSWRTRKLVVYPETIYRMPEA